MTAHALQPAEAELERTMQTIAAYLDALQRQARAEDKASAIIPLREVLGILEDHFVAFAMSDRWAPWYLDALGTALHGAAWTQDLDRALFTRAAQLRARLSACQEPS